MTFKIMSKRTKIKVCKCPGLSVPGNTAVNDIFKDVHREKSQEQRA